MGRAIIEANPDACEMLRTMPKPWHHDVRQASDGVRGLEIALGCPDVVLTVELPRVEGYEVARRFLSTEPRSCGLVSLEDTPLARKAGFDAHQIRRILHPDRLAAMLATRPRELALSP